eukprot:m.282460 g.282460  ORF g.282460 m.282460 type:complete len:89 (+) comp40654_c0_seq9:152-418(+)
MTTHETGRHSETILESTERGNILKAINLDTDTLKPTVKAFSFWLKCSHHSGSDKEIAREKRVSRSVAQYIYMTLRLKELAKDKVTTQL